MKKIKLDLQNFNNAFQGLSAQGTTLSYRTGSTGSYTIIPGIQATPEIGGTPEQLDVTTLDSTRMAYIPGLADSENLDFTGIYQGGNFKQLKKIEGNPIHWRITYPDNSGFDFQGAGFLTMGGAEVNSPIDFTLTIIVSDGPKYVENISTPASEPLNSATGEITKKVAKKSS